MSEDKTQRADEAEKGKTEAEVADDKQIRRARDAERESNGSPDRAEDTGAHP